jgi:heat shock protein HslJ
MLKKKIFIFILFLSFYNTILSAETVTVNDLSDLNGNWHLRAMDGHEVRKARAILDVHAEQMIVNGFDGCNSIYGILKAHNKITFSATLTSTRMACRQSIHRYVSKRLHKTIQEGFTITKGKRYGVEGITLKSKNHDLFFKRMGD